jgi:hypothetical protein
MRQKDNGDRDKESDEEEEDRDIKYSGVSEESGDDMYEEAVDRLRSYLFMSVREERVNTD